MIKQSLIIIGLLFSTQAIAQTGIGTSTPHQSAKLDVSATDKGFLPPRVTLNSTTDATTIPSPATGLLVYNLGSVGLQAGYYYWNGANWATIATGSTAGNAVVANDMVKLYSETYSTSVGKIAHANGFSFTVPVSGRYMFDFSSTAYLNQAILTLTFSVRQGTTVLASDAQSSANNNVHVEYSGKLEVNLQSGTTYNVHVSTTGSRDFGDFDRVYYKLVAGNLPVNQHITERNLQLNNNFLSNDGDNEGIRIDNSGNIGIGTNTPTAKLNLSGGGIKLASGFGNSSSRPTLNTSSIGNYEIRGVGSINGSAQNDLADDGFLRLSAGGGTSVNSQSSIDISGFSTISEMSNNIVMRTAGTERLKIDNSGNVGIGKSSPTEALEVNGNIKANSFIGTSSSALSTTLYLLEAHANVTYTLPGSYTSDPCRYSIVNNTVNVPSSWFNTSNYRFTPQKAGYWEITASYDVYRNSESALMMQKNGSNIALAGAIASVTQQINKIVYLNGSTDYITINNNGGSSNQRSQDSTKSWFQARWVGE